MEDRIISMLHVSPNIYAANNQVNLPNPSSMSPRPSFGFRFGFKIGFGNGKLNYNATISLGVEYKTPVMQGVIFGSGSIYWGIN